MERPNPNLPMLTDFLDSWSMFQNSYAAALLCGGLLSLLGVLVVGRDEVFLAAAVAQASVLGVALALTLGWENTALPSVVLSIAAALAASGRKHRGGTNREEVSAWTFLVASSVAVILLSHAPVGMKHVQSVLTSTILGANRTEVYLFAGLTLAAVGVILLSAQRLTLLILDPVMAAAVGMSVSVWTIAISASLGLVTGLAIRSTGLLFTFGCVVLPALIAKNLCRSVQPMFLAAPVVGIASVLVGLMLAHRFDLPPGQLIVAVLAIVLALAWCWKRIRQRLSV